MIKAFIKKHILPHDNIAVAQSINLKENKDVKTDAMNTKDIEQMEMLANKLDNEQSTTKRIKKDKGLIERVESQKTMITEDNKQLMLD